MEMNRRSLLKLFGVSGTAIAVGAELPSLSSTKLSSPAKTVKSTSFIPELWSEEIIKSYESNLYLGGTTKSFGTSEPIHVKRPSLYA